MSSTAYAFEFRRRSDGVAYRFAPAPTGSGRPAWRRVDLPLSLAWTPERGWAVSDENGLVLSLPWDLDRTAQGPLPPETVWISRKDDKSYVYDLVRV
jgi:hypothetical protein